MLLLKYMLLLTGFGLIASAAAIIVRERREAARIRREGGEMKPANWRHPARIALLAILPMMLAAAITIVPPDSAAVRVSQFGGVPPGTLYAGVHWMWPLIEQVETYSVRDSVYTTVIADEKKKVEGLRVQTKEGLNVGLGVAVRYRLDPSKLAYIHANLPRSIEEELVAPVVASQLRDMAPNYGVRELFAAKRDEFRQSAAALITRKLNADGIVVKEVLLREVQLPVEYARGLEAMLLKEQENERLTIELDAKQKQVKVALLEADSQKEITIRGAEAQAQAKVLDAKAELQRLDYMAEAEEKKVRLLAAANAEKMRLEAEVLQKNPMVIQKIIAERLSDKVQIMMVPNDGKFFFANDVLRNNLGQTIAQQQ